MEMNAICESSLYGICRCKKKYHMPLNLPLYDGHCHVDLFFKYGLTQDKFIEMLAGGRKITLIDNKHQHYESTIHSSKRTSNPQRNHSFRI